MGLVLSIAMIAWLAVAMTTGPEVAAQTTAALDPGAVDAGIPWWVWPIALFLFCFGLGILAVLAGVGGGVLYVPLVSAVFPFHLDFVRGAGLFMALAGALMAAPGLFRRDLATLRLSLPLALVASVGAVTGAHLGLLMPAWVLQICLGVLILGVVAMMLVSKQVENPQVEHPDRLGLMMNLHGAFVDQAMGEKVTWQVHRTPLVLVLFLFIGLVSGMFGLGAGWANVPVLNMVMGVPMKLAVGTSVTILSMAAPPPAWVYLNRGAVLPLMAIPSVVGLMLGTNVGVHMLSRAHAKAIRKVVIGVLVIAGLRALMQGIWG